MSDPQRAPTPPMGWNSWDVYGASVTEREVVDNAEAMARQLRPYGWEYVVVDIQWYEPAATTSVYTKFAPLVMDEVSRLLPAVNRFPSAATGAGFKPLADRVHELGLKFGIHIMRGIPRQAVHANTAILGTDVRARDVAANSICAWNTDMYGVDHLAPGAQAYYDSLFELYAAWTVDLVKVDDVLFPYAAGEIELIRSAIDRCGRPIVLSLSCGPTDIAQASHLRAHAEMWRVTGDFWDSWPDLVAMFPVCAAWSRFAGEGRWPDADMLPVGRLAIRSREHGLSERQTRLSRDEQVTMLTLWCMVRSPLMLGCDLTTLDDFTLALLTNPEVLEVSRASVDAGELTRTDNIIVWTAYADDESTTYLAVFNTGFAGALVSTPLEAAGLPGRVTVRDLWARADLGPADRVVTVEVPSHGARLLKLSS